MQIILGTATAALGPKAAKACTIAVEEVIGTHYDRQVEDLNSRQEDPKLVEILTRFRDEGLEHRNIAIEHDKKRAPACGLMKVVIPTGCKTAIKIAEKSNSMYPLLCFCQLNRASPAHLPTIHCPNTNNHASCDVDSLAGKPVHFPAAARQMEPQVFLADAYDTWQAFY